MRHKKQCLDVLFSQRTLIGTNHRLELTMNTRMQFSRQRVYCLCRRIRMIVIYCAARLSSFMIKDSDEIHYRKENPKRRSHNCRLLIASYTKREARTRVHTLPFHPSPSVLRAFRDIC